MQKNAGFTLIELLVVVLIIGILAAVALPKYQVAVAKARAVEALAVLSQLEKARDLYYIANGEYPASLEDLDIEVPISSNYNYTYQSYGSIFKVYAKMGAAFGLNGSHLWVRIINVSFVLQTKNPVRSINKSVLRWVIRKRLTVSVMAYIIN